MLNGKSSKFFKIAPVCLMTWFTMGYVIPAQAAIIADANQNGIPGIRANTNGSLTVNINAAKGGISHNKYIQFDSTKQGVVLNNATAKTGSVLAGRDVAANANLGGTSASLIINEVTSGRASMLNGQIEVAGAKADVIVANPAGITCSGCGFINTGRGTLTTGTPKIVNNKLTGISVQGGKISIGADGMVDKSDYTNLLAQNLEVGGKLQAQQLQVMTGYSPNVIVDENNQLVNTDNSTIDYNSSMDVKALAGMYANKITLKTTGKLSSISNAGIISSTSDIDIQTNGKLVNNGNLVANSGNINIAATKGITQTGTLSSSGDMNIFTQGALHNLAQGTISSDGSITINADKVENNRSLIRGGDVSIVARELKNEDSWGYDTTPRGPEPEGGISGVYGVAINVTDQISNDGGWIKSDEDSVSLVASGSLEPLTGYNGIFNSKITAKKDIYIEGVGPNIDATTIPGEGNRLYSDVSFANLKAGRDITFNLKKLGWWDASNNIEAGRDINIIANDSTGSDIFYNETAFKAGNDLNIKLTGIDTQNRALLNAPHDINIITDKQFFNNNIISASHDVNLEANYVTNSSSISSNENMNIKAQLFVLNRVGGTIKSNKISLVSPSVTNTGTISGPGGIDVHADSFKNDGKISDTVTLNPLSK